jgi:hypothetical protein
MTENAAGWSKVKPSFSAKALASAFAGPERHPDIKSERC